MEKVVSTMQLVLRRTLDYAEGTWYQLIAIVVRCEYECKLKSRLVVVFFLAKLSSSSSSFIYLDVKRSNKNTNIVRDGSGQQGRNCANNVTMQNKTTK